MGNPAAKPYYDAEFELRFILEHGGTVDFYGSTLVVPEERKFGDLEGVRRYLAAACAHIGWEGEPPKVRARRGETRAHYDMLKHEIAVPEHRGSRHSWALREIVILHELAHAMTTGHGHDSVFCSSLVGLVTRCIGQEAGFLLAVAYEKRGISVSRDA